MPMTSEQLNAFLACTQRFEQIMVEFPTEIRSGDVAGYEKYLETKRLESSKDLTATAIRYFNLCSEELFLAQQGVISQDVWRVWSVSIRNMLRTKWLRDRWTELRDEYSSYPDFCQFIEGLIGEVSTTPTQTLNSGKPAGKRGSTRRPIK